MRRAKIVISVLIWALLMWFVLRSVGTLPGRAEWQEMLAQGGWRAFAAFGLCFVTAMTLRALRFGYLIRKAALVPWRDIALAFPWLFMLGGVTPFRLGDAARAEWVRRRGGSGPHTLGLWVAERATDMLMLVTLGLGSLAFAPSTSALQTPLALLAGLVLAIYVGLALVVGRDYGGASRAGWRRAVIEAASGFRYMRQPGRHAVVLVFTLAIWGVMGLGFWLGLSLALGQTVPVSMALLCMCAVNLAGVLSAAPGNIGSFQAAALMVLGLYGIGAEPALISSTILQAAGLSLTIVLGLLFGAAGFVLGRR